MAARAAAAVTLLSASAAAQGIKCLPNERCADGSPCPPSGVCAAPALTGNCAHTPPNVEGNARTPSGNYVFFPRTGVAGHDLAWGSVSTRPALHLTLCCPPLTLGRRR